jgi:hypothetical protein
MREIAWRVGFRSKRCPDDNVAEQELDDGVIAAAGSSAALAAHPNCQLTPQGLGMKPLAA